MCVCVCCEEIEEGKGERRRKGERAGARGSKESTKQLASYSLFLSFSLSVQYYNLIFHVIVLVVII